MGDLYVLQWFGCRIWLGVCVSKSSLAVCACVGYMAAGGGGEADAPLCMFEMVVHVLVSPFGFLELCVVKCMGVGSFREFGIKEKYIYFKIVALYRSDEM